MCPDVWLGGWGCGAYVSLTVNMKRKGRSTTKWSDCRQSLQLNIDLRRPIFLHCSHGYSLPWAFGKPRILPSKVLMPSHRSPSNVRLSQTKSDTSKNNLNFAAATTLQCKKVVQNLSYVSNKMTFKSFSTFSSQDRYIWGYKKENQNRRA
jgi:hypothetical protein